MHVARRTTGGTYRGGDESCPSRRGGGGEHAQHEKQDRGPAVEAPGATGTSPAAAACGWQEEWIARLQASGVRPSPLPSSVAFHSQMAPLPLSRLLNPTSMDDSIPMHRFHTTISTLLVAAAVASCALPVRFATPLAARLDVQSPAGMGRRVRPSAGDAFHIEQTRRCARRLSPASGESACASSSATSTGRAPDGPERNRAARVRLVNASGPRWQQRTEGQ